MRDDIAWDQWLHIKTTGRDDSRSDHFRYPYEPTDYPVLERLATYGYIRKGDVLLDYGCGKGRVSLFLASQMKCRAIGIEYDERLYRRSVRNGERSGLDRRVQFVLTDATAYDVPIGVNRCYFFNPFSLDLLKMVIQKIEQSCWLERRDILLFFYYPSKEYEMFLSNHLSLTMVERINCQDLFTEPTDREYIAIYRMA